MISFFSYTQTAIQITTNVYVIRYWLSICDSVKGLSSENKKWRNNNAQSQLRKITDKKGKLESYQRKTIIYGDGFHAPEQRIGKYEFEFLCKW